MKHFAGMTNQEVLEQLRDKENHYAEVGKDFTSKHDVSAATDFGWCLDAHFDAAR